MIIGSPYTFPSFRLFELEPRTKSVFGFPTDADVSSCPRLQIGALIHSKRLIHMLDTAIDVVGPDPDLVSDVLTKLGRRHIQYGVKAAYLPLMGMAINHALKAILGDAVWRDDVEQAWDIVYEELSTVMMKSILAGESMAEKLPSYDDCPTSARIAL